MRRRTLPSRAPQPKAADVHAKVAGDRGADLLHIEFSPLDFATLEHVFRKRLENRLLLKVETEGLHVTNEATLLVPDSSQRFG